MNAPYFEVPLPGSPRVAISVLVLADGVTVDQAAAALAPVSEPYAAIGIDLRMTIRSTTLPADGKRNHDGPRQQTTRDVTAVTRARDLFPDQRRPAEFDLVYVLTDKDVWSGPDDASEADRNYSTVGYAWCIGGIQFPDRAFAVGELRNAISSYGITFAPQFTAATAAHELGHLLGAHHHYAVCGTRATALADRRSDVCTIMFPEATPGGMEFSPVNGGIVYGHARDFAGS